jgi:hypothetical protein
MDKLNEHVDKNSRQMILGLCVLMIAVDLLLGAYIGLNYWFASPVSGTVLSLTIMWAAVTLTIVGAVLPIMRLVLKDEQK